MSTKNTTTSAGTFNQGSMNTYNALQPGVQSNLQQFMTNPLQSSFFNTQLQMADKQNQAAFGANNSALLQNQAAGGSVGNVNAYTQSNLLRNQRALSSANSNSFNNLLLGANQLRLGATQQAQSYRPLQTGGTQTQTQGGLGSWLPQLAGAALGVGMKALAPGTGAAFGAAGQSAGAGSGAQSAGFFSGANASPFAPNQYQMQDTSSGPFS